MKTRIGKIAQLPKTIREELNRRLEDGQQGPEILPWLNELPVTKNLLAKQFGGKPISKCNLSDWRQGGYHDWLRLQAREERVQRVAEQGTALEHREGNVDLYECFSRMVIADLALDLELLNEMPNHKERWQRLREVSQEFTRLQNGFNRSRRADLSWQKWNRKTRLEDEQYETSETPPSDTENSDPRPVPAPIQRTETKHRIVYLTSCQCVCRKCHPADGEYPYWEAERDHAECRGNLLYREHEIVSVYHWHCDCTCDQCETRRTQWATQNGSVVPSRTESRRTIHRTIYTTKCDCNGICQKCHPPDGEYPAAQAAGEIAALRVEEGRFIRQDKSVSISLRGSFCECACNRCALEKQNPMLERPPIGEPIAAQQFRPSTQSVVEPFPPVHPPAEPAYDTNRISDFARQQRLLKTRIQ